MFPSISSVFLSFFKSRFNSGSIDFSISFSSLPVLRSSKCFLAAAFFLLAASYFFYSSISSALLMASLFSSLISPRASVYPEIDSSTRAVPSVTELTSIYSVANPSVAMAAISKADADDEASISVSTLASVWSPSSGGVGVCVSSTSTFLTSIRGFWESYLH